MTYYAFSIIQALALLVYVIFIAYKYNSTRSIVMRLISSTIILICSFIRISFALNVLNILVGIFYVFAVVMSAYQLKENLKK